MATLDATEDALEEQSVNSLPWRVELRYEIELIWKSYCRKNKNEVTRKSATRRKKYDGNRLGWLKSIRDSMI